MGESVRARAQRAAAALISVGALAAATTAHGADLRLLVNGDANAATGCTVATANGAVAGVERRFVATVDTTQNPPRVTAVTQETCTAAPATFGAPTAVSGGGWPVGLGNGTGGANVIEVGVPTGGSIRSHIAVEYSDAAIGLDAATSAAGGGPIVAASHAPGHAEPVPTLSDAMLLLLVLLVAGAGWRYGRKHLHAAPLAVVALALVTTLAWAAIVVDGLTTDWAGIPAAATDPADAPAGADITAVFATIEGATLFVRVDARTGLPPAATADSYVAASGTSLNIAAGAGLLANDTRGVPAATVASFGGGSLGGAVTTHAAGATATFGTAGSLTVNADGSFAFTPATGFTGSFTFTYRLGNINGTSDATVTIATQQAPAITSANTASFNVGTAGTFTLTATGFPTPTLSLAGALPAGLAFDASTGVLSGTPAPGTAGTHNLTFTATNGVTPNATQAFTLTVTQGVAITSATATAFTVGVAGTFTVTTTGSPVAGTISITGALPTGVTFTNNGNGTATLAGTPAAATGGAYPITITADNGVGTPGTQAFTLTVNQPPAITSATSATFLVGSAGSHTVTATGFPAPTFAVSGTLPAGVTFDAASGVLSGTPANGTAGNYPLTFTASNGTLPDATQPFTLVVNEGVLLSSGNTTTFVVGTPGTFTITTTGTPTATSITATGVLPSGVTFVDNGNGTATLSGTPAGGTGGSYVFTIQASNGIPPAASQSFTLVVNEAPAFTSAASATFVIGVAGSFTATATGFPPPGFSITAGTLPAGVTLDPSGVLSGTPGTGSAGAYPVSITATNFTSATQAFTLTVHELPLAVDDAYAATHDTPLSVPAPGVLGNDSGSPAPALGSATGTGAPCAFFPCAVTTANGSVVLLADGSFTYTPGAGFTGTDTFAYLISNAAGSDAGTVTITVANALPVVDLNGPAAGIDFAATFTEGSGQAAIVDAAQLTVADTDDLSLSGATVVITNLLDAGAEVLSVTCPDPFPGCSGAILAADVVYTAGTGTLEILAAANPAEYQALLRTLAYSNGSASPTGTPRDITVTINDGIDDNAPVAHAVVTIAGVNQAPAITAPATATTPVDTARVFPGTVSVADPDAGTSDIQLVLTATNGSATLSGTAGLTSVTGNGSAIVTAIGPVASLNAALNGLSFTPAPAFSGAASLRVDADDLGNTGSGGALTDTHTIAITVDNLPAVTTTMPAAGATAVSTTGTLTVNFNEPVNVTTASFALECPVGSPQAFTVSASPSTSIVVTPTASLPAATACRLTVVAAQVTDSVGQSPAADTAVTFTTNTLPTVTSTMPVNGATAVQLSTVITVNFSESVNAAGGAFTLQCPAGTPVALTASVSPASSFTLTPAASLPPATTCSVTVVAAQVTDADASQPMAANHGFTFTTGAPPTITSAAGATFTVGSAGAFAVTTTGTPTITSLVMGSVAAGPGGALPAGVSFGYTSGSSGLLSGTATNAAHVGTYQLSFTASNGISPDAIQSPFTLTLQCPTITLAPAAGSTFTATYLQPFSQAFAPSGGTAPYTYTLGGAALPSMGFSGASLTGTPSNTGSFAFTVQAVDTYGCTSAVQAYTLDVNPSAGSDAYGALGNVLVDSSAGGFTVVSNDAFPAGAAISAFDAASAQGGAVTMTTAAGASLGRFTYNPPTGFTGTDTFTYTLSSNGRTAVGTVTFTVSGMVWFIDSNAGSCVSSCDGRLTNPFLSTGAFQAQNTGALRKPAANHPIFVYSSPASYTGNVTLLAGQRLVGQGATSSLATLGGATPLAPAAGQALPSTGGAPPTLAGAVTVLSNNFIHGLTLGGNVALAGTNFGTLTLTENVAVNTTGGGVSLNTGVLAGGLAGVTSSGGVANIGLTAVTTGVDTFGFGTGALSGATGDAFSISGGDGSFTYGGTITNAATGTRAVNIQNKTGGSVALSGSINPSAPGRGILVQDNATGTNTITFSGTQKRISSGTNPGVALATNTGATIAFTNGGLDIASTTGAGFTATGGATSVTVTGANNVISSAGGAALNVANTTIGGGNLNFLRISATGGASGIVLENTGASGGLVVSGTGSTALGGDASGGTIQNTTSYGIQLTSTRNVSLANVTIQNAGRSGIDGLQVTNFTFANGTINNVGTAALGQFEESNIAFNDGGAFLSSSVDGTVSITGSILSNARRHGIQIENGSGTIANLVVTGNTLTSNTSAAVSLGTAILVMPQGSGATNAHLTTANIANNTINNFPSGEGIFVGGGAGNAGNGNASTLGASGTPIVITGNRIDGGATRMGSNAIRASFNGQNGVANFTIGNNNPVTNIQGQGVSVFMGGTVSGTTTVTGNTIVANQTLGAGTQGLAVQVDDGPAGAGTSAADYNFVITNNNVSNYEGFGIRAIARASLGKMDLTITGNTVGTPILANRNGIRVDSGSAVGDVTVCLSMSGNTSDGSGVNQGMGIRKQGIVSTTNEFGIVGLATSPTTAANAAAFVSANNPSGNGTDAISGDNYVSCAISP